MPAFEYVAIDAGGRKQSGVITAADARLARRELRLKELLATDIRPLAEKRAGTAPVSAPISEKHRVQMFRQLAALLESGMPVEQALTTAASSSPRPVQAALLRVAESVREGEPLAAAMRTAPQVFPDIARAVISAGEASGQLAAVTDRLATQMERALQTNSKIRAALVYPAFLFAMAALMVVALLVVIVPRLVSQFEVHGSELPPLTRAVIALSDAVRTGWPLIVLAIVAATFLFRQLWKSRAGRLARDAALLRLPIIGALIRDVAAARFARVFAILSTSGATVIESLNAANAAAGNAVIAEAGQAAARKIRAGGSLAAALRESGDFPPMLCHMALSGEAGRNIGGMLQRAADYLEREFETKTQTFLSLLEPVVILLLGLFIGTIVLAVMLPIIQLNTLVAQ
jgi:general secretion pathway protein F